MSIPPTMTAATQMIQGLNTEPRKVLCLVAHQLTLNQQIHTTLNTNTGAQGLKLLRDLKCQLSGRGKDESMKPLWCGQQRLEDGQSKGTSLS